MASPDGLRLCLGCHAPSDVLDLVFQYGFHLWLARPVDMLALHCYNYNYVVYETTRYCVLYEQLSDSARRTANYDAYWDSLRFIVGCLTFEPGPPSRPYCWSRYNWRRLHRTGEWVVEIGSPCGDDEELLSTLALCRKVSTLFFRHIQ